jgi:cellulose synthase/poly-beta-1,6-N-acetylglucosamine synthase-like glycosyltransferase
VSFFEAIYSFAAVLLAIYGLNSLAMVILYLRHRREGNSTPPLTNAPTVTVQLPIYNELYVVERLINAVARLDYPRDKLQIQVLDDSIDETTNLAQEIVNYHKAKGIDIELIHREERRGFKAGALQEALSQAKGEFIAIFDADFVPRSDFLLRTIPLFLERPRLGLVQTRWGHINADYSTLTRAQAIALDGHFVVEQIARNRSGLFINFNGTAGVWRKECIEGAGGWRDDTLSEDLDLSYRAQIEGWDFLFLPEELSKAEIPPQIGAFKRQQFRWAKGSVQCLLKIWRRLATSKEPILKRLEGFIHISGYLVHPLMLLLLIVTLPLMISRKGLRFPLAYLGLASLGPPILYAISQRALYPDWLKRMAYFPFLALLGIGIALNNTLAILEAFTNRSSEFRRTPKFRLEGRADNWIGKRYALPFDWTALGEALLTFYSLATVAIAIIRADFYAIPFLLLYAFGFGYVATLSILQSKY